MGFLNGLGRFLQGEKPFQDIPQQESDASQVEPVSPSPVPVSSPFVDEHGYKIIPHITLEHVNPHRSGERMTVIGWITNHSKWRVRIDYIDVLGQRQTFQRELDPGKSHDFKVYEGPVAPSEHNSHAELTFRLMDNNNDLFKNVYHVEFNRESDGKYVVEQFHEDGPTRDV